MPDIYYLNPDVYGSLRSLEIIDCMGRMSTDFFKIGSIAGWRNPKVLVIMSEIVPEDQAFMHHESHSQKLIQKKE